MFKSLFQKYKSTIPYWTVVLAIVLPWFLGSGYLFLTDYVWGPVFPLHWGEPDFLFNFTFSMLGWAISAAFLQKLWLTAVIALLLFGGRFLAKQFLDKPLVVFGASLIFLFNPFVYDRLLYGQVFVVASLASLVWLAGYAVTWLKTLSYKSACQMGMWIALCVLWSPHFIFIVGLFLVALFSAVIISRGVSKKVFYQIGLIVFMTLLLNANWLVATALGESRATEFAQTQISHQDFEAFRTAGNSTGQVIRNVLQLSGFWGKDQYRYTDLAQNKTNWGRSFILLAPLIIFGLVGLIRTKETRVFGLSSMVLVVVATLLSLGLGTPFSTKLTYWLFEHIPFYGGLRDTQKWSSLLVVIYGLWFIFGLKAWQKFSMVKNQFAALHIILAISIVLWAPLLLWGFWTQAKPHSYPDSWIQADRTLVNNGCSGQTLFLPWHLYMRFSFTDSVVANPAPRFFSCSTLWGTNQEFGGIDDNSGNLKSQQIRVWLADFGQKPHILKELDIQTVVVAKAGDWPNYSWVSKLPYLIKMEDSAELTVYQVKP
jgi:hypothetical protein